MRIRGIDGRVSLWIHTDLKCASCGSTGESCVAVDAGPFTCWNCARQQAYPHRFAHAITLDTTYGVTVALEEHLKRIESRRLFQ